MSEKKQMFTPKYKPDDILIVAKNDSGHGFKIGEEVRLLEINDYFTVKEVWKAYSLKDYSLNEHQSTTWNVLAEDMHRIERAKRRKLI